jgi:hypothetical protein
MIAHANAAKNAGKAAKVFSFVTISGQPELVEG